MEQFQHKMELSSMFFQSVLSHNGSILCLYTGENRNGAKTSMFLGKNGAHSKKWSSIPIFSCIRTQNWSFIANVVLHFHTSPICFFMHTPFLIPEHVPFLILGCTYFGPPEPENTPYIYLLNRISNVPGLHTTGS